MHAACTTFLIAALAATPVAAGDFSGFYAGVNAGYVADRSRDRTGGSGSPWNDREPAESGLPPSALGAADRMVDRDRRAASPRDARR